MKIIKTVFAASLILACTLGASHYVEAKSTERPLSIVNSIKEKVKSLLPKQFRGKLKTISGSVLTVTTNENKDIIVNLVKETMLKRRFGANSTLSELMVGDELAVVGKRHKGTDGQYSESEVDAKYIRDLSIQRRNAVFTGTITTKADSSFTLQTVSRGLQNVYISSTTTIHEKDKVKTYADLAVGDKVLVKGELWDRANTKIDAKKILRLPSSK
ncbi:hypothetical protein HZC27_03760 [Candidatus Roizmanbacteria bacterium]|nr:hypothetical protein [Candidatus Roizmanbacteria bacterium]